MKAHSHQYSLWTLSSLHKLKVKLKRELKVFKQKPTNNNYDANITYANKRSENK